MLSTKCKCMMSWGDLMVMHMIKDLSIYCLSGLILLPEILVPKWLSRKALQLHGWHLGKKISLSKLSPSQCRVSAFFAHGGKDWTYWRSSLVKGRSFSCKMDICVTDSSLIWRDFRKARIMVRKGIWVWWEWSPILHRRASGVGWEVSIYWSVTYNILAYPKKDSGK